MQHKVWDIEHARKFYSIGVWSEGYFDINQHGNIVAKPDKQIAIEFVAISEEIKNMGLSLPVLVRFPQILRSRVKEIDVAFKQAAKQLNAQLKHIPCYPVKVNQQRTVIEQILKSDCSDVGLEVGSKTELLLALGLLNKHAVKLICNGYKDRAYIRIALYAQNMGMDVTVVIENPTELSIIEQECMRLGLTPKLGLRVRLNSIAESNWQNSGGKDAKFGLDTKDILYCLEKLKQWECQQWLQLIHFHMGSQISKLNEYAVGLQEAMQIFGNVASQGFDLNYIDVGGGLAVDYASQHDSGYFSRNYSIQEYARVIVNIVQSYCQQHELNIPIIITENGRAITAHHAVLITNTVKVQEREQVDFSFDTTGNCCNALYEMGEALQQQIIARNMHSNGNTRKLENAFETMLLEKFMQGEVSLQQRAWAEDVLRMCKVKTENENKNISQQFNSTIEKYYCNFSLFQSMPDVWGLQQIFPVVPLSRLQEQPSRNVRLHDLTCDSDGQIPYYAFNDCVSDYLTLHELRVDEEYLLGFFLLGAYQEVLGDIHNLFGDTHTLNVEQDSNGRLQFSEVEIGDCANELLESIHLDGEKVLECCQMYLSQAQVTDVLTKEILEEIKNALYGYTYLDSIDRATYRIKG